MYPPSLEMMIGSTVGGFLGLVIIIEQQLIVCQDVVLR